MALESLCEHVASDEQEAGRQRLGQDRVVLELKQEACSAGVLTQQITCDTMWHVEGLDAGWESGT